MRIFALGVLWLLLSLTQSLGAADADPKEEVPFAPGETLTYRLSWGFIGVGQGELKVEPMVELEGRRAYGFQFNVRTNRYADLLFKVRDQFRSVVETSLRRSLLYQTRQRHNSATRDVDVTFTWDPPSAQYSRGGKARAPISLPGDALDPLAAVFAVRTLDLAPGEEFSLLLADGKRHGYSHFKVVPGKVVKSKAGKFPTIVVRPDLSRVNELFKKPKSTFLKVWLSDDPRRIPIRFVTKVKWGSFRADLVSIN